MKKFGFKKTYLLIILAICIGMMLWGISFVERYPEYSAYFFPYFFVFAGGILGTLSGFLSNGVIKEMLNKHPISSVINTVEEKIAQNENKKGETE